MKQLSMIVLAFFIAIGVTQVALADSPQESGVSNSNKQSQDGATHGQERAKARRNAHAKSHHGHEHAKKAKHVKKEKKEKRVERERKQGATDKDAGETQKAKNSERDDD